jgi:hypothetical protein
MAYKITICPVELLHVLKQCMYDSM